MSQNWWNPFTTFLSLCFLVYDGAGSCLDQFRACLSDSVCNRYLAPMLQACKSGQCNDEGCQQETLRFYRNVPQNVAEMLVMCECEASDQSCLSMKTELHSGTCGDEIRVCQRVLNQCTEDSNCRYTVLSSDVFVFFVVVVFRIIVQILLLLNAHSGMKPPNQMQIHCLHNDEMYEQHLEGTTKAGRNIGCARHAGRRKKVSCV